MLRGTQERDGLVDGPDIQRTLFTAPVELKTLNAMENTSTQDIKFGSVVAVWTNLR